MVKKWLLMFAEVNEKVLPPGNTFTTLPDKLDALVSGVLPKQAINLSEIYLVTTKQRQRIITMAEDTAIHYHYYAVDVRGERCNIACCDLHNWGHVIPFKRPFNN